MHKRPGKATRQGKRRRKSGDGSWRRVSALTVSGLALVGIFAVAGYQVGSVAVARSVMPVSFSLALEPAIESKSSLIVAAPLAEPSQSVAEERPIPVSLVSPKSDNLGQSRVAERSDRLLRLLSPPIALLEKNWRVGREQRQRLSEHTCLARAIYFEARSESEIGRLAVARVILNRVDSPFYPDTICDVVYQNAGKRNSCQFSFACDGESDNPRRGKAWEQAKALATRAMAGEGNVQAIATATSYHADYVVPKWSGAMTRLVKIGRHIFYSGT